jgi:hypothetical protein
MTIQDWTSRSLCDPGAQWSAGTYGAIAEFSRETSEPANVVCTLLRGEASLVSDGRGLPSPRRPAPTRGGGSARARFILRGRPKAGPERSMTADGPGPSPRAPIPDATPFTHLGQRPPPFSLGEKAAARERGRMRGRAVRRAAEGMQIIVYLPLEALAESGLETMRLRRKPLIRRAIACHLLPRGEGGRAPTDAQLYEKTP